MQIPSTCKQCIYRHSLLIQQQGVVMHACKYHIAYKYNCEEFISYKDQIKRLKKLKSKKRNNKK